jgi:hypothetical protein
MNVSLILLILMLNFLDRRTSVGSLTLLCNQLLSIWAYVNINVPYLYSFFKLIR